jgi:hypothetical protein
VSPIQEEVSPQSTYRCRRSCPQSCWEGWSSHQGPSCPGVGGLVPGLSAIYGTKKQRSYMASKPIQRPKQTLSQLVSSFRRTEPCSPHPPQGHVNMCINSSCADLGRKESLRTLDCLRPVTLSILPISRGVYNPQSRKMPQQLQAPGPSPEDVHVCSTECMCTTKGSL